CLRAGVAVAAGRAVGRGGVGAGAGRGVAGAGHVALIRGRAGHGVGARAALALAGVALRAGVPVVARRAVGRRHPDALARPAAVARRALVAVITGRPLGGRLPAALPRHTAALRAAVPRHAGRAVRHRRTTHPVQALRPAGAGVVVLAGRPVLHVRSHALAADTLLAHRAGISVVARCPIELLRAAGAYAALAAVARRAAVAV